jgi:predicted permease
MDTLVQDIRYSIRMLIKKPGFAAIAIIALALGIGANTAIFSVVNAVLLRPLPFNEPDRIVQVWPNKYNTSASKAEFVEIKRESLSFEDIAAYSRWSFTLTGRDEPLKIEGARVTSSFFSLLGVNAALGRTLSPEEDQPGHERVIILSHDFWQRQFGADQNIIGQSVTLGGHPHEIIGVMPQGFVFPSDNPAMWVPAPINQSDANDFTAGYLTMIGRLKPGVSPGQARQEVSQIAQAARAKFPRTSDDYGVNASIRPLQKEMVGDVKPALLMLLGAVGFVLLIACANVANLQLARSVSRRKEIAIRTALGAGRRRVVRQLLTESIVLACMGGIAGLLLALWLTTALVGILPESTPRLNEVTIDAQVLGFTMLAALFAGVLFGLAPALHASKADLQLALKEGGAKSSSGAGGRLRNVLVVSEIALVLMLSIGAGLLIKSFWRLQQVNPGFEAESVLSLQLAPPISSYSDHPSRRAFYHEVISRVASLPGIGAAGAIHLLPMGGSNWNPGLKVEDHPLPEGATLPNVDWRVVTPDYFRAMGIPLIKGRVFTEADDENAPGMAIINETLARRYWPGEDPVGKRISSGFEQSKWVVIVGVVGDVKHHGLDSQTRLEMYRPYDQSPFPSTMTLMVRANSDPQLLTAAIRQEVWAVDGDVPIAEVQLMSQVVYKSLAGRRSTMILLVALAAAALILGAVGIYGVISYSVTQRTHEIGIRMALGAGSRSVLRLVIGQGLKLTLIGVAIGVAGATVATRLMEGLLFGVSATDALTFAVVSALMIGVALTACAVPARRATKVDPMVALRYE